MTKVKNKLGPLPKVGDEVRIVIGPAPLFGPMWTQIGQVIAVWKTQKGRRRTVVKVARSLREDENLGNFITDDIWTGSIFVAMPADEYIGAKEWCRSEWFAMYAASKRTLDLVNAKRRSNPL